VHFERLAEKLQHAKQIPDLSDLLPSRTRQSPTEADLAAIARVVEANRANLDELTLILDMEWLYPREATPWTLFPELAVSRQFVRLLCLKAMISASNGNPDEAIPDLLQALRLAVQLPRGGETTQWLCAKSCQQSALAELAALVAGDELTASALQSLLASLGELEAQRVPLRETIAFDYQCQGPGSLKLSAKQFWELLAPGRPKLPLLGTRKADKAANELIRRYLPSLQAWDAAIAELSTHPYYQIRDKIPDKPKGLPEWDALVLAPVSTRTLLHDAALQCRWRAVRIMIHLELLRQKQGGYPAGLDELKGLSPTQLEDPFSGQQFVYSVRDDGYVLYSVGPDGEDNGGERGKAGGGRDAGTDFVLWPRRED
jgi:hypothetical protein